MPSTERAKVYFDASSLRYLHTGLGQFEFNLLREFADVSDLNISALVHPDYTYLIPDGIASLTTNWLRRHSLTAFQKYLYPPCNVWHVTDENTKLSGVPGAAKVVLTIHGLHFLDEEAPADAERKLSKVQRLVNRADAITAVSAYTAKVIGERLKLAGKEIRVIPNGISSVGFSPTQPAWAPQGKFIYAIGTFFRRKNFHVLIPMMKHLPDLTLVLAGDDNHDYGRELRKQIAQEGLTDRILMPGEITDEEKSWLYQNGRALMFPSVSEGFGIPVIECLAFGKLVVCSRYGSLPEVGGDYATYWDNFDPVSMAQTVKQKIAAESPSKSAARMLYASTFTWKNSAHAFLDLYRSLIK